MISRTSIRAPVAAAKLSSRSAVAAPIVCMPKVASAPGMDRVISLVCQGNAEKAMQAVRYDASIAPEQSSLEIPHNIHEAYVPAQLLWHRVSPARFGTSAHSWRRELNPQANHQRREPIRARPSFLPNESNNEGLPCCASVSFPSCCSFLYAQGPFWAETADEFRQICGCGPPTTQNGFVERTYSNIITICTPCRHKQQLAHFYRIQVVKGKSSARPAALQP